MCGGVHVFDLAQLMNCSHEVGYQNCGRSTGWTVDGLHPQLWVMRVYFNTALNVMADFGEACTRHDHADATAESS